MAPGVRTDGRRGLPAGWLVQPLLGCTGAHLSGPRRLSRRASERRLGSGALPLFNPDLEALGPPGALAELRSRIISSHAVLIATPEYAHGVSGVLKNALDWMVGNESFVNKPVSLLNASPRASIAQAALRETLITMSARVVPAACVTVGILRSGLGEEGIVRHPEISTALLEALRSLESVVQASVTTAV